MKAWLLPSVLLAAVLGVAGAWAWGNGMVPVPLGPAGPLYPRAQPAYGEDQAMLAVLLPGGPKVQAFLQNQSDLTLLARTAEGGYAAQLVARLERSRNGRRWRLSLAPGWRLQGGGVLDASRAAGWLAPEAERLDAELRVLDAATLDLRFPARREDVPSRLARWRIPGSGPFIRQGNSLRRFEGFSAGPAGVAGLDVLTDPALLEGGAWAEGLAHRRWAWAAFPGGVAPEDMARVRESAYDEVHLADGTVWFVSRRLRAFHPERGAWPETRLFGLWQGSLELPRETAP